ncbi:MAG: thiamine diphosphokinase [Clostridium sp.]|nr:thiamine diphosphokinase [Clostridium sp.]
MFAVVVFNGEISDYEYCKGFLDAADLIICADGGAAHLRKLGISPNILLGDFDSIDPGDLRYFSGKEVEIINFPPKKDMTDAELAIDTAVKRGYRDIVIMGGLGARIDHTLSNIFLLKNLLDRGIRAGIIDKQNEIFLTADNISIRAQDGYGLTLLPLSERVDGIRTEGLYYKLAGETIHMGSSRGVSNAFVCDIAKISITSGLLLVIKSKL